MTIAAFLLRRRRDLAICAATVVLHLLVFGWAGRHVGNIDAAPALDAPPLILANLRAAPPKATPAPKPRPPPRPAPRRAAAPAPAAVPEPALVPPAEPVLPEPELAVAPLETGAAQLPAIVESLPLPVPPEAKPAKPQLPVYQVKLPPSAELTLDVARTDASGANWSGSMAMSWQQGAGAYRIKVEASISMLVTRVNLAVLTSEGQVDDAGIAPRLSTEKRRGRAQTNTHFRPDEARISFSASERSYDLLPGTQDKATVPMQLAGIARADVGQFEKGVEFLVGEDKDAKVFQFTVVGQEEIDTPMGKMLTWRLARPPRPGAYNSRLEVWLAPAHNWYPVRIRNTEANGAVTTQTIRKIVITGNEG